MSSGICSARKRRGRLMSGRGSLSWLTPTVKGDYNKKGLSQRSGDGLATAVKKSLLPTPKARDFRSSSPAGKHRDSPDLPDVVGGLLNPAWVEWLMGFQTGHTDFAHLATQSSRNAPSRPSSNYGGA
jgi:hypothetical protein